MIDFYHISTSIKPEIVSNVKNLLSVTNIENYKLYKAIKETIEKLGKENELNIDLSRYMVSVVIEEIDGSGEWYHGVSHNFGQFYGKFYLSNNVQEKFIVNGKDYNVLANFGDMVFCFNNFKNSTIANKGSKAISFYVAPIKMISGFEPGTWIPL